MRSAGTSAVSRHEHIEGARFFRWLKGFVKPNCHFYRQHHVRSIHPIKTTSRRLSTHPLLPIRRLTPPVRPNRPATLILASPVFNQEQLKSYPRFFFRDLIPPMRPSRPAGLVLDLAENDSPGINLPILPPMPILPKRSVLPACDRRVTPIPHEFTLELPPYPRELPPYAFHPAFTPGPPPKPVCIEVNATPIRVRYRPVNGTVKKSSPRRVSTEVLPCTPREEAEKSAPEKSPDKVTCKEIVLRHTIKAEESIYRDLTILAPHLLLASETLLTDMKYLGSNAQIRFGTDVSVLWKFKAPEVIQPELPPSANKVSALNAELNKTPRLLVTSSFHLECKPIYKAFRHIALILVAIVLPNIVPAFISMYRGDQQRLVYMDFSTYSSAPVFGTQLSPEPIVTNIMPSQASRNLRAQRKCNVRDRPFNPFEERPFVPTKTQTNKTENTVFTQAVIRVLPLALLESFGFVQASLRVLANIFVTGILVALQ